jgi:hypothetical protein
MEHGAWSKEKMWVAGRHKAMPLEVAGALRLRLEAAVRLRVADYGMKGFRFQVSVSCFSSLTPDTRHLKPQLLLFVICYLEFLITLALQYSSTSRQLAIFTGKAIHP